ncbi:MAG: SprT family zinc-dependent metalloprotease [Methanosarcinaceae archaeon]|nr:SprT family zinc-dependent metalloprotease [Methanosarcinaceae archaeon]MDD4331944.1 SprT family zinc-dependent metalloprotease [Methanosarcinaceae archaeon]MDD4749268.1 SprT family zinc-dependent metalloprotease [Methanosarcinaceae archaeon]
MTQKEQNEQIKIGNTLLDYRLSYSDRKTLELSLELDSGFRVRAPKGMSKEAVKTKLLQKADWIIRNLDRMNEIFRNETQKEFVSGEKFLYRGRRYRLKVVQVNELLEPTLTFSQSLFRVQIPAEVAESDYPELIRPLFLDFYHLKAEKLVQERVKKYLRYFEEEPTLIKVQTLKNKWGSCSKTNQLRFNWRIVLAKTSVFDYVVVHELCHMKYKNHSKAFWNELRKILPDYKKRKEWLRIYGDLLKL